MEHVDGPIHGHYLAAYTVAGEDGHYGYAKVFDSRPDSAWDGVLPALFKVAAGPCDSAAEALSAVTDRAAQQIQEAVDWHVLSDFSRP